MLRFGLRQQFHALFWSSAIAALLTAFLLLRPELLLEAFAFWIAAFLMGRTRHLILVVRAFEDPHVDGFFKNYLLPVIDRHGRAVCIAQASDTTFKSPKSAVQVSMQFALTLTWCAGLTVYFWSPSPWPIKIVEGIVVFFAGMAITLFRGGNEHLEEYRTQYFAYWFALGAVPYLRSRGCHEFTVWSTFLVAILLGHLLLPAIASKFAYSSLIRKTIATPLDLTRLDRELKTTRLLRPRFVTRAPMSRIQIFCTERMWPSCLQLLLGHAHAAVIDKTIIRSGLAWEIHQIRARSIPMLLTCATAEPEGVGSSDQESVFHWSVDDFEKSHADAAAAQYIALGNYVSSVLGKEIGA